MICSYYPAPVTNTRPTGICTPLQVYQISTSAMLAEQTRCIRNIAEQKERQQLKRETLPYCTFGGVFSKRHINNLIQVSGLVCIDFDHVGEDLFYLRSAIMREVTPVLMFLSPSGDGLKVVYDCRNKLLQAGLLNVDCSNSKARRERAALWYADRYAAVLEYIESKLTSFSSLRSWADLGAHDITRACYLCADEFCYINPFYLTIKTN